MRRFRLLEPADAARAPQRELPLLASEPRQARAEARVRALARVAELASTGVSMAQAEAVAARETGFSVSSLRRWRRRSDASGGGMAALMDAPGRGRPPSIRDPEMVRVLEAHLTSYGRRVGAAYLRRVLVSRFGHGAPTERTLSRWIAQWREAHRRQSMMVGNPDEARSRLMPALGDGSAGAPGLNAVWELDSTTADVMCTDGRRPVLIGCIDVWSRRAALLVAPTSRADAVCALLRRCIIEWGVPAAVKTDNGSDYTSRQLVRALADLGIAHRLCLPYHPHQKPHVERFFGTVSTACLAHLPGYVGRSPSEAKALRDRLGRSGRRGKSDAEIYGAELDRAGLQGLLDRWCRDLYGWRPHSGLDGEAPNVRAAGWTGERRTVTDERALDLLLTAPGGAVDRTVQKDGVHVDGGIYIAPELGTLVGMCVSVRRDLTDLGVVHVFGEGGYVCQADDRTRAGVDRAEVAARAGARWRREGSAARGRARDLQAAARPERDFRRHVLEPAERRAGKVAMLPRAAAEHETPALAAASEAAAAKDREEARQRGRQKKASGERPRDRTLAAAAKLYLRD